MNNSLKIVSIVLFAILMGSCEKPKDSPANNNLEPIPLDLPRAKLGGTPKNLPPGTHIKMDGNSSPRELFFAPKGVKNVALKKSVISSDMEPVYGTLDLITNGDKEANDYSYVELGPNIQWVQIDLGSQFTIYAITIWREHRDPRVYKDVVVQVSDDKDFITNALIVFNSDIDNSAGLGIGKDWEFFETYEGQLIDCKGIKARYVRFYANGNTVDDLNRYTEVEVYALPVELKK